MRVRYFIVVAIAALGAVAASPADAAIVTKVPEPVFAIGADGVGRADPLYPSFAADDISSKFGAVGYRVDGDAIWTRCRQYSTEFYGTPVFLSGKGGSLTEGTHYIQVANDYNYNWALHNGYPASYDQAQSSCSQTSSPPPGNVLSVPFIVDRSSPTVSNVTQRQTAPLTLELCADLSDPYSGLYDVNFVIGRSSGSVTVPFTGEKTAHACATAKYDKEGKYTYGILPTDWAYNGESTWWTAMATNKAPSGTTKPPFRFWLTSKRISQSKRSMRVTFRSNETGVKYRCAFAGQPSIKCHSPINFTNLGRHNQIVLKATDKFGRTKTIRLFPSIRGAS